VRELAYERISEGQEEWRAIERAVYQELREWKE
jgi:hypothetical protein